MKKITLILAMLAVIFSTFSCYDLKFGDEFMGEQPESSGATLDTMFSSYANAERVLNKAYTYLPYGIPTSVDSKMGNNTIEALTDLHRSFRNNVGDGPVNLYYSGVLDATTESGNQTYLFGYGRGGRQYSAIRYAWIYLENCDRIPDVSPDVLAERKAEAKMIIAISYAEMLRYVGGVPLLKRSINVNDEMVFPRNTFSETVDYIVQLLDEAIPDLKWSWDTNNDGRMTSAGAMALKLRVLLFAASPTFNSNEPFHPEADEYSCYMNYDASRWDRALQAGKDFFDALEDNGYYALITKDDPSVTGTTEHDRYRHAFRKAYYERGGTEVLISSRAAGYDVSAYSGFMGERYWVGPTLNYANMFPWADGSEFIPDPDDPSGFDWANPRKQPFFTPDGNTPGTPTRDPRLYETIAVPGDIYINGTVAPLHTNADGYDANSSGFQQMKFLLQRNTDRDGVPIQWSYILLAEVMLSYAEAINECKNGPDKTAYEMVNAVRGRVGLSELSGLSKDQFREALLKERACELGFEEVRWFDLVRYGREKDFRKQLYGLRSTGIASVDGNVNASPTEFSFEPYPLSDRYWVNTWDTKWYLAPIPQSELNKNYGMTQNPGW